jgi:hypothetical protein
MHDYSVMSYFYTVDGVMYDENDQIVEEPEEYGNEEYQNFKKEFQQKTYLTLCIEQPLDTILSQQDNIVIYDDRSDSYEYSHLSKREKKKYINYLHVKKEKDSPITLKKALTEIMNHEFYSANNKITSENFNHIFLEDIYNGNPNSNQYEVFLGS